METEQKLRVFTAFSGYDAQCLALERLRQTHSGFGYKLVGWSEIDKHAIAAHNALFPQYSDCNYGDISKIDWKNVPDFDLFTYSSPCTNFSSLGNKKGGEKGSGTASSLLWECEKAISAKKPKYLVMENVSDIKKKQFSGTLHKWMKKLEVLGYSNHAFILNSKDFGVPQDRKRMFMVSFLEEERIFYEPEPYGEKVYIEHILDENPSNFANTPAKTIHQFKNAKFKKPMVAPRTHGYLKPIARRFCPALTTTCGGDYFIFFPNGENRGITTREAFKMMGLTIEETNKIETSGIPRNELFKLAGNSIVVNVFQAILEKMLYNADQTAGQMKLF